MGEPLYTFALDLVSGEVRQRPMRDEELIDVYGTADVDAIRAEWAAAADAPAPAKPALELLADHLATLPPDRVVSASDLLAILRPEAPADA